MRTRLAGIMWANAAAAAAVTGAPEFTERTIDPQIFAATGALAADIDGDGDADILITALNQPGVVWYESSGGARPTFTKRLIPFDSPGARALAAADLDDDNDLDLIVSTRFPERLIWLENSGGDGPAFVQRPLWNGANGARRITAIDFDADGDTDVVAAGQFGVSAVAWLENAPAVGGGREFIERIIPCSQVRDLSAAPGDIDGDGDTDVVVTRNAVFGDGWIGWLENLGSAGGAPPTFAERPLEVTTGGEHNAVVLDFDADGDADILSASFNADKVSWFEQVGQAPGSFVRRIVAEPARGASEALSADFDGDGDLDVLAAMYHDGEVRWHERTPAGWVSHLLRAGSLNAEHVAAADLDADGDIDAVAALFDSVVWYDNNALPCPGDTNGDRLVDFFDLNVVLSTFGLSAQPGTLPGDLNADGRVDFADLNEVLSFFSLAC